MVKRYYLSSRTNLHQQKHFSIIAAILALGLVLPLAWTTETSAAKQKAEDPNADEIAEGPPEPENMDLQTVDGLTLSATFYPGTNGKDTVPIILIHMWKGNRNEYASLAPYLQSMGHAVLVPDMRGHGDSKIRRNLSRELDASKMPSSEFQRMVTYDMEAMKSFLIEKNNAGKLNIEKLCIVGAEMGASVALDWARLDWSWPILATGKQGQDVKALVLISPQWSFRGLPLKAALADPRIRRDLSILILCGGGTPKAVREAKRLHSTFKKFHPDSGKNGDKSLFYGALKTSLQGTKLLSVESLRVNEIVARFIDLRLAKQRIPWKKRVPPI